jgi:hypothetical protein
MTQRRRDVFNVHVAEQDPPSTGTCTGSKVGSEVGWCGGSEHHSCEGNECEAQHSKTKRCSSKSLGLCSIKSQQQSISYHDNDRDVHLHARRSTSSTSSTGGALVCSHFHSQSIHKCTPTCRSPSPNNSSPSPRTVQWKMPYRWYRYYSITVFCKDAQLRTFMHILFTTPAVVVQNLNFLAY